MDKFIKVQSTQTDLQCIINGMDFVRFSDAKVGRAFKHAIDCWLKDMSVGTYEASDVAEPAFQALTIAIRDYVDEIAMTPEEPKKEEEEEDILIIPPKKNDDNEDDDIA